MILKLLWNFKSFGLWLYYEYFHHIAYQIFINNILFQQEIAGDQLQLLKFYAMSYTPLLNCSPAKGDLIWAEII